MPHPPDPSFLITQTWFGEENKS